MPLSARHFILPGLMSHDVDQILEILDRCCESFTFPMLDNGYVYLAATRLSLYFSPSDWAFVIEVFGFSPRAGSPDVNVCTFASHLHARNPPEQYVTGEAHRRYIENNPHNESRFFFPLDDQWQDDEDTELVSEDATEVLVRNRPVRLPAVNEYATHGIMLEEVPRIRVFELCRFLAEEHRDLVLATPSEQRVNVLPELNQILQLEEWRHPDLLRGERPSTSVTFQMLAKVLTTGDGSLYQPTEAPNTHWGYWPDAGTL